jgi:hypothetical protein
LGGKCPRDIFAETAIFGGGVASIEGGPRTSNSGQRPRVQFDNLKTIFVVKLFQKLRANNKS